MARTETDAPDGLRVRARIVRLYPPRGFGFLLDEENVERFFHATACLTRFDELAAGDVVTFVPGAGPKGPVAYKVLLEGPGE